MKVLRLGGIAAGAVLVALGIGALALSIMAFGDVRESIEQEQITATPDAGEITDGTLEGGEQVETGADARAFAEVIRTHALEATEGRTFAELDRFVTPDGGTTNDPEEAATDEDGAPVENPPRELWITATALSTALNTAFMAEQLAIFGIVVGAALVLAGIGFAILAWKALPRGDRAAA